MFSRKYTKPLSKGELSRLHGQDVRVHFLNDNVKGNIYRWQNLESKTW